MAGRYLALLFSLAVLPASAQLPASGKLADSDWPLFRAEVARVEKLLSSASDRATVTYQMARTWASAKQWPETMQWLQKVAGLRAGLDPSRDSIFTELRGTRDFEAILAAVSEATPVVSHSSSAFTVPEGDLIPESVAFDPKSKHFYFGSMNKGKVVRCSMSGDCTRFASGLGVVLGLKVHGNSLWLLSNSDNESALIQYDLASARVVRKYPVTGAGHNFNDLVIAPAGNVYLTDTRAGVVWHLATGSSDLTRLPERFEFANGIAISPDGRFLYVSTFPDGISVVDLPTHIAAPIARPADLCLATIDGLYFYRGALVAIQNGFMTPRVVRFTLTRDLRAIERFDVLERRNPLFEGVTTGVVVGGEFFYMANIQDDKKTAFNPITILKLHL
ncbi:MAG: SMP-30/gluconolactonase/LRE family protein [Acidobacteriia bacterium]|nr:SMP-30/gluconolactonase/LRE family protein [Terriglobia bacterium]